MLVLRCYRVVILAMIMNIAPPEPAISKIETSLFNRMVKNAFVGFTKSAAIGAVLGLLIGGVVAAAAIAFPQIVSYVPLLEAGVVSTALHTAAWFAGLSGSFGAVAGIQSTRDTRRFFLMHEAHNISPERSGKELALHPEMEGPEDHFQKLVVSDPEKTPAAVRNLSVR